MDFFFSGPIFQAGGKKRSAAGDDKSELCREEAEGHRRNQDNHWRHCGQARYSGEASGPLAIFLCSFYLDLLGQ